MVLEVLFGLLVTPGGSESVLSPSGGMRASWRGGEVMARADLSRKAEAAGGAGGGWRGEVQGWAPGKVQVGVGWRRRDGGSWVKTTWGVAARAGWWVVAPSSTDDLAVRVGAEVFVDLDPNAARGGALTVSGQGGAGVRFELFSVVGSPAQSRARGMDWRIRVEVPWKVRKR